MRALLLILLSMFLVISCNKKTDNKEKTKNNVVKKVKKVKAEFKADSKSVLFMLPENTLGLVNVKSIESVFSNFMVTDTSVFGMPFPKRDFDEMQKILGFNPGSLKDLDKLGINTKKELGLAFMDATLGKYDDFDSVSVVLYIPLKDSKKTLAFIESKFENGKWKADENAKINFKKEKEYIKIFGNRPEESLYIFVKNDYFFLVFNPVKPQVSLDLTNNILKGKTTLKDSKVFQETLKLNKTDNGLYGYANIEAFIKENKVKIEEMLNSTGKKNQMLDLIKSYRTISMSLAFDTKEFALDFSVLLDKTSKALSIFKGVKYNNSTILGLDKPALALMSFGFNIPEYLKLVSNLVGEDLYKEIDKTSKEFGVNIMKDLILNLDGNFAFGTYDGMGISTTNYNATMTVGFKDAKLVKNVIEKLLADPKLKDASKFVNKAKEAGKDIYIINAVVTQVYVGFNNNELVVSSSKDMFKASIASSAKTGFYKKSKSSKYLTRLANSDMVFYLSFLESMKALNNFKGMLPPQPVKMASDILEVLDYFLVESNINEDSLSGSYILKTHSKDNFFPGVIKLVKKYNK